MTSNLFSIRRGILSRPGVCTPAPPPPPVAGLVFVAWDVPPPLAYSSLHASYWQILSATYPLPDDDHWHFTSNCDVLGVTLVDPPARTYEIEVNITATDPLGYIHATVHSPPADALHASTYFPVSP